MKILIHCLLILLGSASAQIVNAKNRPRISAPAKTNSETAQSSLDARELDDGVSDAKGIARTTQTKLRGLSTKERNAIKKIKSDKNLSHVEKNQKIELVKRNFLNEAMALIRQRNAELGKVRDSRK